MITRFLVVQLRTSLTIIFVLCAQVFLCAQVSVKLRSSLGSGGSSGVYVFSGKSYLIQQSVGQESVIGTHKISQGYLYQGFIQPLKSIKPHIIIHDLNAIVYPNPFSTEITIEFGETLTFTSIVISDMVGRIVYRNESGKQAIMTIPLQTLASGTYLLQLVNHQQQRVVKLVKE